MGSDCPPEQYEQPKGFSVSLGIDDPLKAEHIFHALAEKRDSTDAAPGKPSGLPALAWLSINLAFRG
jgi:hypothetical protein